MSDLTSKQLVQRYEAGETVRMLAESVGVSYGTMHTRLVEGGARMRPRGFRVLKMSRRGPTRRI